MENIKIVDHVDEDDGYGLIAPSGEEIASGLCECHAALIAKFVNSHVIFEPKNLDAMDRLELKQEYNRVDSFINDLIKYRSYALWKETAITNRLLGEIPKAIAVEEMLNAKYRALPESVKVW